MAKLDPIEKRKLEKLFEMEIGWVLDFSDARMVFFFVDAVQVDIEDRERYGDASKTKRMREFWRIEPEYRVPSRQSSSRLSSKPSSESERRLSAKS